MSYAKRLIGICDGLIEYFDWKTIEEQEADFKEKGSRRIYSDEKLMKRTFESKSLSNSNFTVAITQMYNSISASGGYSTTFSDFVTARTANDFSAKRLDSLQTYLNLMRNLVELYDEWEQNQFQPIIETVSQHALFKNSTKRPEVTPELIQKIHDLVVNEGKFQVYKYREGSSEIKATDSWKISTEVGFSQDLTQWLRHVDSQKEFLNKQSEDEVFVTLFGKLDEVSDIYSNWIITMHKKDSIWIMTDQVSFNNPSQKVSRLGREGTWDAADDLARVCDLPYEIFDNMDEVRKSQTGIVPIDRYEQVERKYFEEATEYMGKEAWSSDHSSRLFAHAVHLMQVDLDEKKIPFDVCYSNHEGGSFPKLHSIEARYKGRIIASWADDKLRLFRKDEFLFMDMNDMPEKAKLFMLLLPGKFIEVISSEGYETPKVMLSGEFIQQKLIEGAVVSTAEPEHLRYWNEDTKTIFKGIIDTIEAKHGHSGALVPRSFTAVTKTKHFNSSWLSTPEQHESLSEWLIADEQLKSVYPRMSTLRNRREKDTRALIVMMNENKEGIHERIMVSKEATFFDNVEVSDGGSFGGSWRRDEKFKQGGGFTTITMKGNNQDAKRGWGIGKLDGGVADCECEQYDAKQVKRIYITHYRELMWVIGCRREELPPYYQNYRRNCRIPYSGNSLLDQVHPFANLTDPASRAEPNGLYFYVYLCGRCLKKKNIGPAEKEIKIPTKLKKYLK